MRWRVLWGLLVIHAGSALRPCSSACHAVRPHRAAVQMLARKPFKGGRLDDFVKAGEAEAKYGPRRYAAVADDAWKISVEQSEQEAQKRFSAEVPAPSCDPAPT